MPNTIICNEKPSPDPNAPIKHRIILRKTMYEKDDGASTSYKASNAKYNIEKQWNGQLCALHNLDKDNLIGGRLHIRNRKHKE